MDIFEFVRACFICLKIMIMHFFIKCGNNSDFERKYELGVN